MLQTHLYISVYITTFLKFFVEGVFCYLICNCNKENKILKFKQMLGFSFTYSAFICIYDYVTCSSITYRFLAVLVVFALFWFKSKNKNDWGFPLTHSAFINLLMESSYLLGYRIFLFILGLFGTTDTSVSAVLDKNLLLARLSTLAVYIVIIFCIYKIKFLRTKLINIEALKEASKFKAVSIFLVALLIAAIYAKHNLKTSNSANSLETFSNIVLFFPFFIMPLIAAANWLINYVKGQQNKLKEKEIVAEKLYNKVEKTEKINKKLKKEIKEIKIISALDDATKQAGKGREGLYFNEKKYQLEHDYFKKKLEKIGLDKKMDGTKQAAFAAVLIKNHADGAECADLKNKIYPAIQKIMGNEKLGKGSINGNIKYAIDTYWNCNSEAVKKIEKYYPGEQWPNTNNAAPTPKEFLICIVNEAKQKMI